MTLYGIVASFHLDDVKDSYLSAEKKQILKEKGQKHIHVTFAYISDDNRHNQAFVQHVNKLALDFVTTTIMKRPPLNSWIRTDGAPTQYANATMFFWIGQQYQKTNTRVDWSIHCTCHGPPSLPPPSPPSAEPPPLFFLPFLAFARSSLPSGKDKVDPEMGWLKNLIRAWMLTETLDNMYDVRLHNYLDVAQKLRDLNADDPGHGALIPGGIYRREIMTVDARGPKSAPQDIPKGLRCVGATKDRQFTDQCCELEKGASSVLMRHRSCHFCDCCIRLDPMDRANRTTPPTEVRNAPFHMPFRTS